MYDVTWFTDYKLEQALKDAEQLEQIGILTNEDEAYLQALEQEHLRRQLLQDLNFHKK